MVVDSLWDFSIILRLRDDVQEQLSYELIRRVASLNLLALCSGVCRDQHFLSTRTISGHLRNG